MWIILCRGVSAIAPSNNAYEVAPAGHRATYPILRYRSVLLGRLCLPPWIQQHYLPGASRLHLDPYQSMRFVLYEKASYSR